MQYGYESIDKQTPTGIDSSFITSENCLPSWVTKEWLLYKGVLGTLGLLAGAVSVLLFLKPAENYAKEEDFGIFLTEEVGFSSQWLFFASALFYIGTINSYSVSTFSEKYPVFLQQRSNNVTRFIATLGLALFSFVELLQPYSAARGTGSSLNMALLATLGFFPMTLYVGINAAKEDLPWIFYHLSSFKIWFQENTFERVTFFKPAVEVVNYRFQRKELEKICGFIQQKFNDGWLNVLKANRNLDFSRITLDTPAHEKVAFLLRHSKLNESNKSPLTSWIRMGLVVLGVMLLFPFLYADVRNLIYQMTQLFMWFLAIVLGVVASTTLIYFTTTFNCKFLIDVYEYFCNKPGKPINWLTYHLSPIFAWVTTPFNIITPMLSYTVAEKIFRENYDLSEKDTLNYTVAWWAVVVAIVLYHMLGQIKVSGMILKDALKAFGNERQKALISLSSVVSEYRTPYELALEVEKISESDKYVLLGDKKEEFKDVLQHYKDASTIIRTAPCCSWRRNIEADEEVQSFLQRTASSNFNLYDSMGSKT